MPNPSERWSKRKFHRVPGGESRQIYAEKKTSKKTCGICSGVLLGVPHGKTKSEISHMPKTTKRPSGMFGGVLCSNCRSWIIEEAAKIKTGIKKLSDVSFSEKKYVQMALGKVGE